MNDEQAEGPSEGTTGEPMGPIAHLLVAAFILGLIIAFGVVLGYRAINGSGDDRLSPTVAEATRSGSGTAAGLSETYGTAHPQDVTAPRPRLARCAEASLGLENVLIEAQPALDQWAVHVGAMNKLVLGEITLQQATAFWDRTRVAARHHVDDFRGSVTDLRRRGVDCPSPSLLAPGARALPGCVRRVAAHVRALGAARTSIDTWEHHIHDMEMLRSGELSPEDATAMWLSMWQQGVRDLDAYDAAAEDAEQQDECTPGAAEK